MIGDDRVLGLIPARGGSRGLPGKHLLHAGGRPLIAWTIAAGRAARSIDRLVLSSDDEQIIATARAHGCDVPFRRPAQLATDDASSIDVVLHALDALPGYGVVVLLQPTSPQRTATDIDTACARLQDAGAPACVSVARVELSPHWMYELRNGDRLRPVVEAGSAASRRQELPPVYMLNGAIYVARTEWLRRSRRFMSDDTVAYVMPARRSIDIDTRDDFEAFRKWIDENPDA